MENFFDDSWKLINTFRSDRLNIRQNISNLVVILDGVFNYIYCIGIVDEIDIYHDMTSYIVNGSLQ